MNHAITVISDRFIGAFRSLDRLIANPSRSFRFERKIRRKLTSLIFSQNRKAHPEPEPEPKANTKGKVNGNRIRS